MRSFLLVGVLLTYCSVTKATPRHAGLEELWLGNECEPMALFVESVRGERRAMGLTRDVIATTVRSRLRAAGLYWSRVGPYLYVNVHADPISGEQQVATTWDKGLLGSGGNANDVLSGLSRLTDIFIDEYLRVNEQACKQQD